MAAKEIKADRPSHGAWILFLPCASISPKEAEPGGSPRPKKSRLVSAVIEPVKIKGIKVRVATMAFGRTWRCMMVRSDTPSERAAFT